MAAFRNHSALVILCLVHLPAQAQTETILHNFGYFPQGLSPCGTVIRDAAGNLYGTTLLGGATDNGVVFERGVGGKYKVLYSFKGAPDAAQPNAGVTEDAAGNLYGATTFGGVYNQGAIYKLTPGGAETVLYSFTGGADGAKVYGGVTLDPAGNLYGTASAGGSVNGGVVWELSAAGQFTVLHDFAGFPVDGATPDAGVTLDPQGNLYGTTSGGGTIGTLGTVFKLSSGGAITLLHTFTTIPQANPQSGLVMDGAGNLYGAVEGAAYEVSASGQYTQFNLPRGADIPVAGIPALDGAGNLYVVTGGRGTYLKSGALFKVNLPSGESSRLYAFPGPPDERFSVPAGNCPAGNAASPGVVADASGNLYGSSEFFGLGGGLFEIAASTGAESTLYQFPPGLGGSGPDQIIRNRSGVIFGVTQEGGKWNAGALYALAGGAEHTLPLPVSIISKVFGQDGQGNLYICGGDLEQLGSVYRITSSGQSTLLYTFTDGSNCLGVTADAAGNVYGTTQGGPAPQGQVFRLSSTGEFTSLHVFSGGSDGGSPNFALTLDKRGNVYGTTFYGGTGGGVLFRISPNGTETVLHDFIPATGAQPSGDGVALDAEGNIYGAAAGEGPNSEGVLYRFSASSGYKLLYAFVGGAEGGGPATGITLDAAGNIYGTTSEGGDPTCPSAIGGVPVGGCGVLFEFSASGSYSVLHAFTGGAEDGGQPSSAPVLDSQGNVYGATSAGGPANYGTVYKVAPLPSANPGFRSTP